MWEVAFFNFSQLMARERRWVGVIVECLWTAAPQKVSNKDSRNFCHDRDELFCAVKKKRCVGWKEKIKPAVATTFTDASRHTLALLHSKDESCHWRAQIDKFYSDETTAMRSDNDTIYNGADVSPWQPVWWGKHVFGGYEMPDAGVKVR